MPLDAHASDRCLCFLLPRSRSGDECFETRAVEDMQRTKLAVWKDHPIASGGLEYS